MSSNGSGESLSIPAHEVSIGHEPGASEHGDGLSRSASEIHSYEPNAFTASDYGLAAAAADAASAPKRLELYVLPERTDIRGYKLWKHRVRSAVCSSQALPGAAGKWYDDSYKASISSAQLAENVPDEMASLDYRLYDGILRQLHKNKSFGDKLTEKVISKCETGCGRQALRVLERYYERSVEHAKALTSASLMLLECSNEKGLEDYVDRFRALSESLATAGERVPNGMQVQILKDRVRGHSQAAIEAWELAGKADVESLLEMLESRGEQKNNKGIDSIGRATSGLALGAEERKTCPHCKKQHTGECWFKR